MIAVDTSAMIAILWQEHDAKRLRMRLADAGQSVISAGTLLELQRVLAGAGAQKGWPEVEALMGAYAIAVRPFDEVQLGVAREAALRFGRGRHPAALNLGDCFAYALAKSEGLPLLYVGNDFARTDIAAA